MDYVKGLIPVRLNGELCTIPGFLSIACTSGSGFVFVFLQRDTTELKILSLNGTAFKQLPECL
jgi:hypothetical protein